jgi:hypothetical protein
MDGDRGLALLERIGITLLESWSMQITQNSLKIIEIGKQSKIPRNYQLRDLLRSFTKALFGDEVMIALSN